MARRPHGSSSVSSPALEPSSRTLSSFPMFPEVRHNQIAGTHSTPHLHPHLQVVQRPAPPGPLYQAQNHGGHSLLLCCTPGPSST
ncbi:hypothetical protein CHARACLAT_011062 [Characodon lateralis]|uniref:Uncharacterized protein n=1 Tax=Characodon lateralis TaxID=208331 RepID=A0ABU7F2E0_9TELE|nr:hypothetical protein [Characodon lateralis]